MMFEKVTGSSAQKLEVGEVVEGLAFHVEHEQGSKKNSNVYHIRQKDGSVRQIWGSAIIDGAMEEVTLPKVVRITFDGKGKTANGSDLNLYTVEIDADDEFLPEYPTESSIAEAKDATNPLMDEPMPEEA